MLGSSGYVPGLFPPDHHAFLACGSLRPPSCQFRLKGTACPRLSPAVGQDGHLLPCLPPPVSLPFSESHFFSVTALMSPLLSCHYLPG